MIPKIIVENPIESGESWEEHKEKLKIKFAYLLNNDPMFDANKRNEILKQFQIKLGKTEEELLKIITAK